MPRRTDLSSVLVIGSGPIVIGQAAEFDYSGTQACRVLRAEGLRVVLVNSNPATIMTDPEFADATYVEPITPEVVEAIIAKERPDALLATLGGQTALNAAMALHADGVFFSNGPGDPAASTGPVELLRGVLDARLPFFGICFGNQLLGRALGLGTYKLGYGHRGINQPVLDRATGRVEVTAHNHGFAVDAPLDGAADTDFGRVEVSHVGLNDGVVEGLRCLDVPAFSVQYHPEAAAGPHDAGYLFDRFVELMQTKEQG